MLARPLVPFGLALAALLGASHRNFQGTFVVSGGGSVASARISHFY
jgi:hypothetical protein